jgi:hypothetical protein
MSVTIRHSRGETQPGKDPATVFGAYLPEGPPVDD